MKKLEIVDDATQSTRAELRARTFRAARFPPQNRSPHGGARTVTDHKRAARNLRIRTTLGVPSRAKGPLDPLPIERVIVLAPGSVPAERQQSLDARLDAAVAELTTAELLLEEAVTALRTGTKEKIVVEPNVERVRTRSRGPRGARATPDARGLRVAAHRREG